MDFIRNEGPEAINDNDILPGYKGVSVHDRYSSYDNYSCEHSLCNSHLLRDLKGLVEDGKSWASQMIALLLKAKKFKETTILSKKIRTEIFSEYDRIVSFGFELEPVLEESTVKKRGRKKKPKIVTLVGNFSQQEGSDIEIFCKAECSI